MLTSGERSVWGVHRCTISSTDTSTISGVVENKSSCGYSRKLIIQSLRLQLRNSHWIKVDFERIFFVTVFTLIFASLLYQFNEFQVITIQLRPVNDVIDEIQFTIAGGSTSWSWWLRTVEVWRDHVSVRLKVQWFLSKETKSLTIKDHLTEASTHQCINKNLFITVCRVNGDRVPRLNRLYLE